MNERQLITRIAALAGGGTPGLVRGIGDDCAVVRKDDRRVFLLTTDTLIEQVHFSPAWHPPEKLGRKAVSVNVSDIAAMGGTPLFVLLSMGLPPGHDPAWFTAFTLGLAAACRDYGCTVIGGDTVASPQGLTFTLTVIGEAEAEQVVYRNGARVGDTVWVSGQLGFAAAGLELLSRSLGADDRRFDRFRDRHLDPVARVALGRELASSSLARAMMDLSDGLATDLAHLCHQSGVGAEITAVDLPGLDALAEAAVLAGCNAEQWATRGGEDYELLFTADPDHRPQLLRLAHSCGCTVFPVGRIVAGRGVVLVREGRNGRSEREEIAYQGYDHFRSQDKD